ncbi:EpsG family protein [Stutzerimonas chloritidismutans]|uniref:EpsG family protein n=1 Tax=Stutzerimonas chloritidismutans TaxID=203192 RepID=UPI003F15E095
MVYIFGWILLLFILSIRNLSGYHGKFFLIFVVLYFGVVSIFRGDVGVDTAVYDEMFRKIMVGEPTAEVEPGFFLISKVLLYFIGDPKIAVRFIAFIFAMLLTTFFLKSDDNETYLGVAYYVPVFCYSYSMNGLRIGLASALFLLAIQSFRRGGKYYIFLIFALLFHYSIMVSILLFFAVVKNWRLRELVYVAAVGFVLVSVFVMFNYQFLLLKVDSYASLAAPGMVSGLSTCLVVMFVFAAIAVSHIQAEKKLKTIAFGSFFLLVFWIVGRYSYAGLRLLELLAFTIPLALLYFHSEDKLKFNSGSRGMIFVAGCLGSVFLYRNFLSEEGVGASPFLPYQSFFRYLDIF